MKRVMKASMAVAVGAICSLSGAQVIKGTSSASGVMAQFATSAGASLTISGQPYVWGVAPAPYDRSGPTQNVVANLLGKGTLNLQGVHVRADSDVNGSMGNRFAHGSSVVQNVYLKVGSFFTFTMRNLSTATKVWGTPGKLYAGSSVNFDYGVLQLAGNTIIVQPSTTPNQVIFNDKGISVTLNEQATSGDGKATKGRLTTAVHIKFANVPANGGMLSGDVHIGRTAAQLKAH